MPRKRPQARRHFPRICGGTAHAAPDKSPQARQLSERMHSTLTAIDENSREFLVAVVRLRRIVGFAYFNDEKRQPFNCLVRFLVEKHQLPIKAAKRLEKVINFALYYSLTNDQIARIAPLTLEKLALKTKREKLELSQVRELIARAESEHVADELLGITATGPEATTTAPEGDAEAGDGGAEDTGASGSSRASGTGTDPIAASWTAHPDLDDAPPLLEQLWQRARAEMADGRRPIDSPAWRTIQATWRGKTPVAFEHVGLAVNVLLAALARLERLADNAGKDTRYMTFAPAAYEVLQATGYVLAVHAGAHVDPELQVGEDFDRRAMEMLGFGPGAPRHSVEVRTLLCALARIERLPEDIISRLDQLLEEAAARAKEAGF